MFRKYKNFTERKYVMNQRLETLIYRILKGNDPFACRGSHLAPAFKNADQSEKLQMMKNEYSKTIQFDGESLLCGYYPSFSFTEGNQPDIREHLERINEKYHPYKTKLFVPGGNHYTVDFEYVIKHGISALLEKIEIKKSEITDECQKNFLNDLYCAGQLIVAWAEAYAQALDTAAKNEKEKKRCEELLQMANICRRVPNLPATSFREAIQCYYFTFILFPDGMGRLDQYLYPYYHADTEKGVLTRKQALDLIEELFIKVFAFFGKDEARSANNHCVIGGYTPDGECGHNECTSLILEAVTELPLWRPQVSYRVTAKTTAAQMEEVINANYKRPDLVMFLNDDAIMRGLESVGVSPADAANYSSSGCNETVLTGCSQVGALEGHINIMHSLEKLMRDSDNLLSIDNFNDFYHAYEEYLHKDLDLIFRYSYDRDSTSAMRTRAVHSLLTTGCIDSATPIEKGGAKYNFCTWCLTGIVNLADSLSIIKQMVFDEKRFTLAELGHFLKADWEGFEDQRSYIRNNGRYFGNDDDRVDLLVNKISASVNAFAKNYTPYRGGMYLFGTLVGYELSHMVFGKNSGASIDGRYAGEPFAASITAFPGADKNGMTAYLKSAAKIDENLIQSSVVVNLKLHKALADTEEKRKRLVAVLRSYFKLGGIQLQINYLSADELIKAQKNPEQYQHLRVRVTGFSGFFTSFDKNLQDEIINRCLHTN